MRIHRRGTAQIKIEKAYAYCTWIFLVSGKPRTTPIGNKSERIKRHINMRNDTDSMDSTMSHGLRLCPDPKLRAETVLQLIPPKNLYNKQDESAGMIVTEASARNITMMCSGCGTRRGTSPMEEECACGNRGACGQGHERINKHTQRSRCGTRRKLRGRQCKASMWGRYQGTENMLCTKGVESMTQGKPTGFS